MRAARGFVFIGPTPEQMRLFGLKHTARRDRAEERACRCCRGRGCWPSADEAVEAARAIGYPVMLKSTAGGGGIGMRLCRTEAELRRGVRGGGAAEPGELRRRRACTWKSSSGGRGTSRCRFSATARGTVVALGERDCSAQRRNQKVIEETPAPGLPEAVRAKLVRGGGRLGQAVKYRSAGTVEFLYDSDSAASTTSWK